MTIEQHALAILSSITIVYFVYRHVGWEDVKSCYAMWLDKKYWTNYNIIEAVSWITKAIIIVPGLIFDISIWWLYFISLFTSALLIWTSNKKLLPTLVGFNTLWIWLSMAVIAKNII